MVIFIRHDDSTELVTGDTCWTIELPIPRSRRTKFVVELSVSAECLDTVVRAISNDYEAVLVVADAPRSTQAPLFVTLTSEFQEHRPDVCVIPSSSHCHCKWRSEHMLTSQSH